MLLKSVLLSAMLSLMTVPVLAQDGDDGGADAPVTQGEGEAAMAPDEGAATEVGPETEPEEATDLSQLRPPPPPKRPLGRAMDALRRGDWAGARIAARGDGPVAQDVIQWHYLRAGRGTPEMVMDFLTRNGDWPGLPYLREKSEATMSEAAKADVLAFFDGHEPETPVGALTLARATDDPERAAEIVRKAYLSMPLSAEERGAFADEFGAAIEGLDEARLDMVLWNRWDRNAAGLVPFVSEDLQALAVARVALQNLAGDVDTRIAAVPEALADDPGLAHDRFEWRMKKGRTEDAVALLLERSTSAEALGRPDAWAGRRRALAREFMRAGQPQTAYDIASKHFTTSGSDFADLEWLSGFLALRFLDAPEKAVLHFEAFRDAVDTPISLGRAGYWLGRAYEALGSAEEAQDAYALGAAYQTSFYGLLAAERGNLPIDLSLAGTDPVPDWNDADFMDSPVLQAAILLLASGEDVLAERFFTHLSESLDATGVAQLGAMLDEMEQPHIQVMVGKRAASFGLEVPAPYYALHPLVETEYPVPTEIVLAIARRESEFDPNVVSGAGARGLMQVMPATAKAVAGWLDLPYAQGRLLSDWRYNATLGAAYLASLSERFDGNVVFMAAGYNAGPGRPVRWAERYGDPRTGEIDVIDWIELIPFNETRNYVMRVAESLPVYRARLGKSPHPVPFSQELTGSTLLARAPEGE